MGGTSAAAVTFASLHAHDAISVVLSVMTPPRRAPGMVGLEDDFFREWLAAASSSGDSGDDAGDDAGECMGEGSQLLPTVTHVFHRAMEDAKQRRSAAVHVAVVANLDAVNRQWHVAATLIGTCGVELTRGVVWCCHPSRSERGHRRRLGTWSRWSWFANKCQ